MMPLASFVTRLPRRRLLASGAILLVASFSLHQVASAATPVKTNQVFTAAVGDSYTSGTGAGTSSGPCDASLQAYPQVAAKAVGAITLNYACAGATLSAFNSTYNTRMAMIKSLDSLSGLKVSYVSMTIGGNDVGALQAIPTLLAGGSTAAFDKKVDALVPKLTTGYKEVRTAVPEADVYVLAYPNILPTDAAGYAACNNLAGVKVTSPENATKALNDLNAGIKKAVAATKDSRVHYVPIDTFGGHDFCSATPWANGLTGSGALHPNVAGQAEMARVLVAATKGKTVTTTTAKPTTTTAKPTTTTAKPITTTSTTKAPVTVLESTTTSSTTTSTTLPTSDYCRDRLVDLASASGKKTPDHTTGTCYPETSTTMKPTTTTSTTKVPVTVLESTTTTSTTAKPTTTTSTTTLMVETATDTATPAPALAFTGSNTMGMMSTALFLMGIGLAMMWARLFLRERRLA